MRKARPSWSLVVAGADAHGDQEANRSQLCDGLGSRDWVSTAIVNSSAQ
jgi:hypothetical protein